MGKVAKSYRNQYMDTLSPRFKRIYEYQLAAVDEMLKTGKPVEVKFRDWRALARFRRKVYELGNLISMRLSTKQLDPYTLVVHPSPRKADAFDEITISGRPVEKTEPVLGIGTDGEAELTPEQEERIAQALEKVRKEDEKETDTEDFVKKVFGEGSQDDKGDKP